MSIERELLVHALDRLKHINFEDDHLTNDLIQTIQKHLNQPARKPLSDEEVIAKYKDIALDNPLYVPSYYAGFRDAERTHGIGGGEC